MTLKDNNAYSWSETQTSTKSENYLKAIRNLTLNDFKISITIPMFSDFFGFAYFFLPGFIQLRYKFLRHLETFCSVFVVVQCPGGRMTRHARHILHFRNVTEPYGATTTTKTETRDGDNTKVRAITSRS